VTIRIPPNWTRLLREDPLTAKKEQLRVRSEFQQAFAGGLVAGGFSRSQEEPRYLLYRETILNVS
jgi:hypothetical protein